MDTITLAPIRLTQPEYFRLLVKIKLRKSGWLYAVLFAMGFLLWMVSDGDAFEVFLIAFSLSWPFVIVLWLYSWSRNKDNRRIYEERTFTISAEKIIGTTPSGSRGEIPWSNVVRVTEIDGRYLLYISAGQMLILNKAAFPDAAAEQRFLVWLAGRKAQ